MAKVYNELTNYKNVPKELVFDKTLSDRARFVYVFMSCKPSDWDFYLEPMAKEIGYSVDTLRKYINELVESGWLEKGEQQTEKGKFGAVEYVIKATKKTDTENFRHGKNPTLTNNNTKRIIDDRQNKDKEEKELKEKSDSLFEECWKAYRRKGSKKKSFEQWKKLSAKDKECVLSHIKAYAASRELQYQKDFERYLRDKIFLTLVYQGSKLVYDPTRYDSTIYTPQGRSIWLDENTKSYWTDDNFYYGVISDGYTDDNRPDGATLTMSNARGVIIWDSLTKKWEKQ